jgi:hypothetical protein
VRLRLCITWIIHEQLGATKLKRNYIWGYGNKKKVEFRWARIWGSQRLTALWTSTASYKGSSSFTYLNFFVVIFSLEFCLSEMFAGFAVTPGVPSQQCWNDEHYDCYTLWETPAPSSPTQRGLMSISVNLQTFERWHAMVGWQCNNSGNSTCTWWWSMEFQTCLSKTAIFTHGLPYRFLAHSVPIYLHFADTGRQTYLQLPNLYNQVSVCMHPRDSVTQLYPPPPPQTPGFSFFSFCDSQAFGGSILTCLHAE